LVGMQNTQATRPPSSTLWVPEFQPEKLQSKSKEIVKLMIETDKAGKQEK